MWAFLGILGSIWSLCWLISAKFHGYDQHPLKTTPDGKPYALAVHKGRTYAVVVPGKHSAAVRFRRETPRDVWAKNIGLADEMTSGERRFDDSVYVESDSPAIQIAIAQDGALRQIILQLLETPVVRIEIIDGFVAARFSSNPFVDSVVNDELINRIVPQLDVINAAMTRIEDTVKSAGTDPALRRSRWVLLTSWTMLATGYILKDTPPPYGPLIDSLPLWEWTFLYGGIVAICIAAVFLSLIGKSALRHVVLFDFLISGFLGTLFLTYYVGQSLNQESDTAAPRTLTISVQSVERAWIRGKRSGGRWIYYVHAPALYAEGSPTSSIQVPGDFASSVRNGDTLLLDVNPGRLGVPWIVSIRIATSGGKEYGPWPGSDFKMRYPTLVRRVWNTF